LIERGGGKVVKFDGSEGTLTHILTDGCDADAIGKLAHQRVRPICAEPAAIGEAILNPQVPVLQQCTGVISNEISYVNMLLQPEIANPVVKSPRMEEVAEKTPMEVDQTDGLAQAPEFPSVSQARIKCLAFVTKSEK
jgi:hypothetical protein